MSKVGTLYLVATPIGNLGDITARAVQALERVDCIACEDTRRSRKLLSHLGIHRPLLAVPSHDEKRRSKGVIERLLSGLDVAFISDAGTPGVSDPGSILVARAAEAGLAVVPIPGPSASIAAISVCGFQTDRYCLLGFLPRKRGERMDLLTSYSKLPAALVIHEAPGRVEKTLIDLAEVLGANRQAVICRELTKLHEEVRRGSLGDLAAGLEGPVLGEVTLVVAPPSKEESREGLKLEDAVPLVLELVERGERLKDACKAIAVRSDVDARALYREVLDQASRT